MIFKGSKTNYWFLLFSFPSLQKKCSSDTVLSEDYTDDYAEPHLISNQPNSASLSDNVYSQAFPLPRPLSQNPINHYSKPLTPGSADIQPFLAYAAIAPAAPRPLQRQSPPRTLNLKHVYGGGGRRVKNRSVSQLEVWSPVCPMREMSPSQSSRSSVDRIYARNIISS